MPVVGHDFVCDDLESVLFCDFRKKDSETFCNVPYPNLFALSRSPDQVIVDIVHNMGRLFRGLFKAVILVLQGKVVRAACSTRL
jgi:hypothetical protein